MGNQLLKTLADIATGKKVDRETMLEFCSAVRFYYDDWHRAKSDIDELRREIAQRDAEIEILKRMVE
jgi:hypothetical protein